MGKDAPGPPGYLGKSVRGRSVRAVRKSTKGPKPGALPVKEARRYVFSSTFDPVAANGVPNGPRVRERPAGLSSGTPGFSMLPAVSQ
jgi:hypothetical protein